MAKSQTRAFIDREAFQVVLDEVKTVSGTPYEDPDTVYGDMSRLVVGWLARQSPAEIDVEYKRAGWRGRANSRALHEAAKRWLKTYRPSAT